MTTRSLPPIKITRYHQIRNRDGITDETINAYAEHGWRIVSVEWGSTPGSLTGEVAIIGILMELSRVPCDIATI